MGAEGVELLGTGSERTRRCASGEEAEIEIEIEIEGTRELQSRQSHNRQSHCLWGTMNLVNRQSAVAQSPRLHTIDYRFAQPTVAQSTIALAPSALFAS